MDPRQPGEIDFAKDIVTQLQSTAVLVAILSPSYMRSKWCRRELAEFVGVAGTTGGLFIQNGCRVLKVYKLPVDRKAIAEIVPALDPPLGFTFYEFDTERNAARELFIHENPEVRRLYDPRVDDVAQAASRVISSMGLAERTRRGATKGGVYLAATTEDVNDSSLKLRRELEARGYDILPIFQLPLNASKMESDVRDALQKSRCSIHLFGARVGWIPEGETRSVVRLQHELAAQHQADGFSRVLWIPPGLVNTEPAQAAFLESLRRAPGSRNDFELAEVPFEELKAIVLEKLEATHTRAVAPTRPRRIYLVGLPEDDARVVALQTALIDMGHEVDVPLRSGNAATDVEDRLETLKRADVVAIYWGTSSLSWVREQQRSLRDVRDASAAVFTACLVVAAPDSPEKQAFRSKDLGVVRLDDVNELEPLTQFLASAERVRGMTP